MSYMKSISEKVAIGCTIAVITAVITRRYKKMKIIDKQLEKLDEKVWYSVRMDADAIYSIGVMTLIGTLSRENRKLEFLMANEKDVFGDKDVVWNLNMNKKQKIALEEVAKDYIIELYPIPRLNSNN